MDCAACGKPISVTAKFCGKCGAPVKRPAKAPETETAPVAVAEMAHEGHGSEHAHDHVHEEVHSHEPPDIEGLVVTLTPPMPGLDGSQLLDLNLDLTPLEPAAAPAPVLATEAPAPAPASAQTPNHDNEWLQRLEQHQQELKKTLEKHSLLLDFISLASQQQTHQQSQPNPSEELLHSLIEQQTQFAVQLAQVQNHLNQASTAAAGGRLPEELKLLLEKQKIEIQKSFSLGITQNTDNLVTAQEAEMTKVQEMLTANTLAAQAIEKNLTPLIQSVNDLKTKVQAVVKKVDELPASSRKSSYPDDSSDKQGGGAMVFVIGMLCGLTVVLSSLAIYNFLSHDSAPPDKTAAAHDTAAHDAPAGHDKPAEHSSAKEKAH